MPSKENCAFEAIWDEWLNKADLGASLQDHRHGRARFVDFVERQIRKFEGRSAPGSRPKVMEVGCGTAIDSLFLASRFGATFYASDLSHRGLLVARRMATHFPKPVYLVAADLNAMCFPDESFDLVFSQGVLEHFPEPDRVIAEQARVTKRGGLVIIDVPQTFNLYTLYKKYKMYKASWPYGWETHYSARKLKRIGHRHGLEPVASGSWGDTFGFVLQNKLKPLKVLDAAGAAYFRMMNRVFPDWGAYYRQNVSVCFLRVEPATGGKAASE
jgi:ubiquinone/menaquinone biosynthesis C-methylase UbiE